MSKIGGSEKICRGWSYREYYCLLKGGRPSAHYGSFPVYSKQKNGKNNEKTSQPHHLVIPFFSVQTTNRLKN